MARYRTAIIACGTIARVHARAWLGVAGQPVALGALADTHPDARREFGDFFGIPEAKRYADFREMLDAERPDIVHIATPPPSHLPLATRAICAGCHVFVEKPLTLCHADSQQLVASAIVRNRKLTIGYGFYFDPIARTLRRLIAEGALGEPVHIESVLGYALSGPFGSCVLADDDHWVHRLPGKLAHNLIDHLLNKVAEFMSDRPTVQARAWRRADDTHPASHLLNELRVMLFDQDRSAYVTLTSHARPVAHLLTVYGTKRTARLDFEAGTIIWSSPAALPGPFGRLSCIFGDGIQCFREGTQNVLRCVRGDYHTLSGLNFLINAFYESIRNDTPVPVSYHEILKVAAISDAVFAQLGTEHSRVA